MSPPKILIATFGSLGDLHPFVALAQALQREGCRATIATSVEHRDLVLDQGIDFFEIRPGAAAIAADLQTDMGGLAQALSRDDRYLFEKVIFPHLRVAYDQFYEASEDASLIVAHSIAFSAHAVAETRGLPLAVVVLSPVLVYSAYDPPAHFPFITEAKGAFARAYNRAAQSVYAELVSLWAAPLRRFRRELGLPRRSGFDLFRGAAPWASTLALCSPLLAPPRPDHPPQTLIAGHSFFDRNASADPLRLAALEDFLRSGASPIVFSLGSFLVHHGANFYRHAMQAVESLGERAVLLVEERDVPSLGREAPPQVFVAAYAPHSTLFPRAKINVHHGGVGTCGQALRAGRPQLVTPFFGDQPDNAARLVRLGVARTLPGIEASAETLTRELAALRRDPLYQQRARSLAASVAAEDGAAVAARRIVEILNGVEKRAEASNAGQRAAG